MNNNQIVTEKLQAQCKPQCKHPNTFVSSRSVVRVRVCFDCGNRKQIDNREPCGICDSYGHGTSGHAEEARYSV